MLFGKMPIEVVYGIVALISVMILMEILFGGRCIRKVPEPPKPDPEEIKLELEIENKMQQNATRKEDEEDVDHKSMVRMLRIMYGDWTKFV